MPAVTVRNLSDETYRALGVRAAQHGCSTEAEIIDIFEAAVRPEIRVKLGSLLASIRREADGLTEADVSRLAHIRTETRADPPAFS